MLSSWRSNCFKGVLSLSIVFGLAFPAYSGTWWKVNATNNTGSAKTSLFMDYSGTGGTLVDGRITANGGPKATIVAASSTTTVTWSGTGLASGNSVEFIFYSGFSAETPSVTWNPGAVAGTATIVATSTPAEVPVLGTVAAGGLILLLLVTGAYFLKRRRLARAA